MLKLDHRQTLRHLYHPSGKTPALIDIPAMNFLVFDGRGKPNGHGFQQAAATLFPLAYTLKWLIRLNCDIDYHVMPMEVRWHVNREKKEFAWTMMLMQPEMVSDAWVNAAREKVLPKVDPALLEQVRFESFHEGMCVQFLHLGPYEAMDAAMERMVTCAQQQGYDIPVRSAHDIYLNDIRKTKPENLKAVMRFAVTKTQ